ncbi:hypothetical protein HXX76_015035 [Chlamydomonas incerta]|uniref:BTB domain-containing protein n=1 Tax=Chlamydomonas incerta TaxID=51695 RepID=A0A835SB74_CHLIN|nr:hypothetical protein HXX76_015035 [Chlamydomonas incerta]|eukprot:KAG2423759.1 hypothetical protein HXX76_015035 [Chlamydomonas incerta]
MAAPAATAAAACAAAGEVEVTTLQMEGWGPGRCIFGVCHFPAGTSWGPAECLIFITRNAVYRLPLGAPAAGGPGCVGSAVPQLLAGRESEELVARLDGSGSDARFQFLGGGIAMDGERQLLLRDWDIATDTTSLRLMAPDGTVSTVAGVTLPGMWMRPAILPNGYLAAYDNTLVKPEPDSDDEEQEEPYWTRLRIAVIATNFAPPGLPAAAAAAAGPPPRSLPGDLGALLDAQPDSTADLTIRVGERRFHVHRAILSARCDYFKQRLAGDAFEDARAAELELPDADPNAFALLLRWLYTGAVDVPADQGRGVAELADRLLLPSLCTAAQDVVAASVGTGTIADSLLWAAGCCESRGGNFTRLLARLKRWYVERAAEVRREARDGLRALMQQQPDLMLELMEAELMEASGQRAVKRSRLN